METLEKVLKNNETNLPKDKRLYLIHNNEYLAPCTLDQKEDEYVLNFRFDGMTPFSEIKKLPTSEKYRALANCAELEKLRMEYYFSMEPENLIYDINLKPCIIMRDAPQGNDNFIEEYKALVGEILYPRYKFADYYLGGKDLYKKKAVLRQVAEQETVEDLSAFLLTQYSKESDYLKQHKLLVTKKSAIAARIAIPVLSAALIVFCVKGYFVFLQDIPYKNSLIQANSTYIAEDYLGTQRALSMIGIDKLPLSEKFILAKSYVITESLTAEQKENVLAGITLKTDERVLDYWIELGRLNFTGANDYAKRLGDDELLLFALIKESASIKDNASLAGEEKATRVKELESQIKTLSEQMQKKEAELLQTASKNTNGED